MPYTATLRGHTTGEGTPYPWRKMPAGLGADARQASVPLPTGGAVPVGADVAEVRELSFDMRLKGDVDSDVQHLRDDLVAAWAADQTSIGLEELTLVLAEGDRVYRGRPRGVDVVLDEMVRSRQGVARCVFVVYDPLWYSGTTKSVTVTVADSSGGMVTPMVTPMVTTGTGSSGDASVSNSGSAPAPWMASIVGPVTTPRLILNGVMIQIDGDIPPGSVLTVDSRTRSALLDGQPRPWVSPLSSWWEIPPGQSTFSFRAVSGTGAATLTWRDASY